VRKCTFTSCTRMHTNALTHMHTHTHARTDSFTQTHKHTRAGGRARAHTHGIFPSFWSGAQRQCAPQVCLWLYYIPSAPCWVYLLVSFETSSSLLRLARVELEACVQFSHKFFETLYTVTVYSKCTRALIIENFGKIHGVAGVRIFFRGPRCGSGHQVCAL
jgi:hypothetical protein